MKKCLFIFILFASCSGVYEASKFKVPDELDVEKKIDFIVENMTLREKAGQMLQPERQFISNNQIRSYSVGSVLNGGGSVPGKNRVEDWRAMIDGMQQAARSTRLGIPLLYGLDAVHGHNNLNGAVMFPHNIGLGASRDPEIVYKCAFATGESILSTGTPWTFAPAVIVTRDSRWGRSYESFGEDPQLQSLLGPAYSKGLRDAGAVDCVKHFAGDGGTEFGTSKKVGAYLDQGDTRLSFEEFERLHLAHYKDLVDSGALTVMVSYSSYNGVKMHQNKELITGYLKNKLGFDGLVISDYDAVNQCSGKNYYENVVLAVNAGIDMIMEPVKWKSTYRNIIRGVNSGDISQARVDDAVRRILRVKYRSGVMDNPIVYEEFDLDTISSDAHKAIAQEAAAKTFVLLKNNNSLLPLASDAKVYITGPAADSVGVLCGGWTISWQGGVSNSGVVGLSIREAFAEYLARSNNRLVESPEEANVVLVVIGEQPYAEYFGDVSDLSLDGGKALSGNLASLRKASESGKPVVVALVSPRPMIVTEYIDSWNSFVTLFLPGSEGARAFAQCFFGEKPFSGKLPITWPRSNSVYPARLSDGAKPEDILFDYGSGIRTGGF